MDQNQSLNMDKKLTPRPNQQTTKLEATKDNKKSNGSNGGGNGRRQQQRDGAEYVWVPGGGNSRKQSKANNFRSSNAITGRDMPTKSGNRFSRNRENEGQQVNTCGNGSGSVKWHRRYECYDSGLCEEYDYSSQRRPTRHGHGGEDITHEMASWWGGSRHDTRMQHGGNRRRNGGGVRQRASAMATRCSKPNKARALQARCQFVVNFTADAAAQARSKLPVGSAPELADGGCNTAGGMSAEEKTDPDTLVTWAAVEEVILHMTQSTHCPVCLYPPVAPQVTRCGHVYCYSCILHYLALSDHKWRECPICYDMVVRDDLKSVVCVVHPDYSVGGSIKMVLMRRGRDSLQPESLLEDSAEASSSAPRKTRANRQMVKEIISRERCALDVQMVCDDGQPEVCFIEQALVLLTERESKLEGTYADQDAAFVSNQCSNKMDEAVALENGIACMSVTNIKSKAVQSIGACASPREKNLSQDGGAGVQKRPLKWNNDNKNNKNIPGQTPNSNWTHYDSVFDPPPKRQPECGNMVGVFSNSDHEEDRSETSSECSSSCSSSVGISANVHSTDYCSQHMSEMHDELLYQSHTLSSTSDGNVASSGDISIADLDGQNYLTGSCMRTEKLQFEFDDEQLSSTSQLEQFSSQESNENIRKSASVPDGFLNASSSSSGNVQSRTNTSNSNSSGCSTGNSNIVVSSAASAESKDANHFYFYQASDGSHVYLNPLNMAMVTAQYADVDQYPRTIEACIVEKDYYTMDENGRSRWRQLRHLPLCCPYEVVELQLLPPFISQNTLHNFHDRLERRQQQRSFRARQEQLIERRNLDIQDKEITSHLYTRVYSATRTNAPGSGPTRPPSTEPVFAASSPGSLSNTAIESSAKQNKKGPPSFAKIVLDTPTVAEASSPIAPVWPSLGQPQSKASNNSGAGSPWGASSTVQNYGNVQNSGVTSNTTATAAEDDSNEDHVAPSYSKAFSLDWDAVIGSSNDSNSQPSISSSAKKTKKGKRKYVRVAL